MHKIITILISVVSSVILYSLLLGVINLISQQFDRNSLIGNSLETILFFMSHLGFGIILLPVLMIFLYIILRKKLVKSVN